MGNNIIDKRIEKFTLYESENHISIDTSDCRLCDLVKTDKNKITAAFIVKACNEYDKLKEQIEYYTNVIIKSGNEKAEICYVNRLLKDALQLILKNGNVTVLLTDSEFNSAQEAINKCESLT